MKKIGSILCDGGKCKDYRRNIYLKSGRLICDGNDITPNKEGYRRGRNKANSAAGVADAVRDVSVMYASNVWDLQEV